MKPLFVLGLPRGRHWYLAALALLVVVGGGCMARKVLNPDVGNAPDARADVPGDQGPGRPDGRPIVGACPNGTMKGRANGQACSCHDACTTGLCVDGVCCNSACTGTCQACNVPGRSGTCSPLPEGAFPVLAGQCGAQPAATCGLDGRCDGRGGCRGHVDGTICLEGRCEEAKVVGARTCARGACREAGTVNCAPYGCDPASHRCFGKCASDDQCAGFKCQAGSCGKKPLGAECDGMGDCESGICADGVCCNTACSGPCLSCRELGRVGRCAAVGAGNPDPHGVCAVEEPETCGRTGFCNGQGGCARYAPGSVCKPASCSGATLNPASVCNEDGTCVAGTALTCAPFLCAEGACRGTCQSNDHCLVPAVCVGTSCGPKGLGQPCQAAGECASNFCIDGVCCDSACTGTCLSCALPNEPGHCTRVPTGLLDPRAAAGETDPARACFDQGAASCGTNGRCDGQGGCQRYEEGAICQPESCDLGTNRSAIGTCGEGSCRITGRGCAPHLCNGDRCGIRCDSDLQCQPPNVCQGGSCGRRPDGEPCSENRPEECVSNICAQGVCCGTPCAGSCLSCALPKSAGVCSAIPAGGADPAKVCVDQKPGSCGTDGKCDGNGGCRRYAAGTLCSPPVCKDGVTTKPAFCDPAGTCPQAQVEPCTPIIVCNAAGNACEKTCTKDTQCMAGTKCFGGKCGLLDDGKVCDEANDCKSGFCVDGICCNAGCGGTNKNDCQACSAKEGASKDGVCSLRIGRACNDGSACTKTDTCVAADVDPGAICQGGAPVVCKALDQCHVVGTCDPKTGACSNPAAPDTMGCSDGNQCTEGDQCAAGVCKPGAPKMCAPADQCRNLCDPATGTCNPPKANGTKCDDGNKCTPGQDTCAMGVCVGKPKACAALDQCHVAGTCDAATGTCSNPDKPDDSPCEKGNRCLGGDKCTAGVCVEGATAVVCDNTHCRQCNPATGMCTGAMKPNTTACEDGNKCTKDETCKGGECQGGASVCTTPDCQACNSATGACTADPAKNGMKCRDGNDCTGMERCQAGACVAGTNKMCPLPCQTCQPADATCLPLVCPVMPDAGM